MDASPAPRIAVDIGGTFTDVALDLPGSPGRFVTAKTPTTPADPVIGAMDGVRLALDQAGIDANLVGGFIHGTTLATNALIERKGATVGVITTAGFRDILEIAYERRYNQYDIFLDKPEMLVPRERCLTVLERMNARGEVLEPLDEAAIDGILASFADQGVESIAVCLLHAYANPAHERRLAELIAARRPDLPVSLSSEVSPEAREYDRLSTTVANAYIRPLMQAYLEGLDAALTRDGFACPLYIMTSSGGMTTLETAVRFPIRLVESGPSGGAILAARVAETCGLDQVVSFDVGGTTAKICLIDDGRPQGSRQFEIGRAERFMKGSGLPVRIPVIEMIEIGAGGGSIAAVDRLGRITVGPESAGSEPGPACFGRGGRHATVTDSDLVLGHVEPAAFAEGRLQVDPRAAKTALTAAVGDSLGLDPVEAAYGVSQIVDENMANAGRVHAIERGKDLASRTMIAFGGNGPLHATRVAERMGVGRIVIPRDPGVGSAIGFLHAPVAYEIVRSHYTTLDRIDLDRVNRLFAEMREEAMDVVEAGARGAPIRETRTAYMRYRGQGHEIEVDLPARDLEPDDLARLDEAYQAAYRDLFHRSVPGMTIEVLNWSIAVTTVADLVAPAPTQAVVTRKTSPHCRPVFFGGRIGSRDCPVHRRDDLVPGDFVAGPALIVEGQTTTLVGADFDLLVDRLGNLQLTRRPQEGGTP